MQHSARPSAKLQWRKYRWAAWLSSGKELPRTCNEVRGCKEGEQIIRGFRLLLLRLRVLMHLCGRFIRSIHYHLRRVVKKVFKIRQCDHPWGRSYSNRTKMKQRGRKLKREKLKVIAYDVFHYNLSTQLSLGLFEKMFQIK